MLKVTCCAVIVIAFAIVALSTCPVHSQQLPRKQPTEEEMKALFVEFTHVHNKIYSSKIPGVAPSAEYQKRFEIFKQNVEKSRQMNAKEGRSIYGITKFSDLTPEEFKKQYLMKSYTPEEARSILAAPYKTVVSEKAVKDAPEVS